MEETQEAKQGSSKTVTIVVVVILVLLAAGYFFLRKNNQQTNSTTAIQSTATTPTSAQVPSQGAVSSAPSAASSSMFKDGTYTAEGHYATHAGNNQIKVQVTLKNDVITDATATSEAQDPMSVHFQGDFIANFKPMVIGKKITDVQLTKVASSSLTPIGFNDALKTIESQAKS